MSNLEFLKCCCMLTLVLWIEKSYLIFAWTLDWKSFGPLQQAALVLNASRRFRYTLDLKKEEEKEQRRRMIRAHAQVIRVMFLILAKDLV